MRSHSVLLLALATFCLTGCAGAITAWKNDPLQSYKVEGPSIYAMTGDRRTAVFSDQTSPRKYCAESLPDAVAAIAASSRAAAKTKGVEVEFGEATAVGLLQTFQRTEIAEVSRQLGWNTCLAWAQGAISNAEYHALLQQIVAGSIDVMKKRASQPVAALPAGSTLVVAPGALEAPAPKGAQAPPPTAAPK